MILVFHGQLDPTGCAAGATILGEAKPVGDTPKVRLRRWGIGNVLLIGGGLIVTGKELFAQLSVAYIP